MSTSHSYQQHPSDLGSNDYSDQEDEERQRVTALWKPQQMACGGSGLKAHRHIHIDWPNASIKKTLAIGASAPDASPPVYDRPRLQDEECNASSCVLVTKSSPINATVHIVKEPKPASIPMENASRPCSASSAKKPAEKPILISAKTGSVGSICLSIPTYTGARPLHIRAKSVNGNITVFLPTSFSGLLNWTSETGSLKVSSAMQQRFKSLDSPPHKHRGTAKIVPSTASGLRGDVCTISNRHGSIVIKEFDEDPDRRQGSCVVQ
ncbi:uncharacterized protein UMAG_02094 [Mycosarcoma maydis]|uniref:DUF7330 domain-containing protein n=1 Tax=Mycosarcoma maydis TaxID=5270 RepID=A0A0D1C7Y0_MYCMD|nr:uncharacterized protein UMAG_02094 [Ustilago maydis 521]KIS69557.1 hypothetical protein UMAG_02094 [Ustilago maydis 521]|eukprot:XP_011388462.1 hypothetical protein UMAG_02094 [Ustilago maydis 521]